MTKIAENVRARIALNDAGFVAAFDSALEALPLSKAWIEYFTPQASKTEASPLLATSKVSMVEAASAWSIGSNRGAAICLRSFVESVVAWEYYRDHAVEFGAVMRGIADLALPKFVFGYLNSMYPGYEKANEALFKHAIRSDRYFYTNISNFAHAHPATGGGTLTVDKAAISVPPDPGFLALSASADEFVSDLYATRLRKHWTTLPEVVRENVTGRMGTGLGKWLAS